MSSRVPQTVHQITNLYQVTQPSENRRNNFENVDNKVLEETWTLNGFFCAEVLELTNTVSD